MLTVNVTIMMVLASIYLSVSNSLPKTPDLKPIEIWLLFNLVYNFSVIMLGIARQVTESQHLNISDSHFLF